MVARRLTGRPSVRAGSSRTLGRMNGRTLLPTLALLAACSGETSPLNVEGSTLPPGSALPGDAECAARVVRSPWEPRPENAAANQALASAGQLSAFRADAWGGVDDRANTVLRQRVTGAFSGTTDEIIQWAACKWGIDADVVRAQVAAESWWHQDATGDLTTDSALWPPSAACQDATHCYQSYGLLQIKWTFWQSAWPMARDSTAFNLDAALAWRRVCYEGYIQWLSSAGTPAHPGYGPGDLWGCVGQWVSGGWYDAAAVSYVGTVRQNLEGKVWLGQWF